MSHKLRPSNRAKTGGFRAKLSESFTEDERYLLQSSEADCSHLNAGIKLIVHFTNQHSIMWWSDLLTYLLTWCFKLSQPQRIISGLKETFIKRYTVQRTNKAEIRPEEQSEKAESWRENSWNEMQLKGP